MVLCCLQAQFTHDDDKNVDSKSAVLLEKQSQPCLEGETGLHNEPCCLPKINSTLAYCKLFYLFFNAALGSLWPSLPLHFRQLFLTPRQVGTIVACRTLVQFIWVPLWLSVAERYRKHKMLLLISVFFWLASTVSIILVPREQPRACPQMKDDPGELINCRTNGDRWFSFNAFEKSVSCAPGRVARETAVNSTEESTYSAYDPSKHVTDTSQVFILLLLCTIVGISMASPAQVLADVCTFRLLRNQDQSFGKQVLWGAVGFGTCSFLVGSFVSFSTYENPCTKQVIINYQPCFFVFAFFMSLALLIASQIEFQYDETNKVDSGETRGSLREGLKTIHDIHLVSLLVVTFCCGVGHGFISTFLLWHLREMGALQILLALVSLTDGCAELLFFIFCDQLMQMLGYFRIIYLGLLCFSIRFFYYGFLREPWLVLPVEILHGMTSAAIRSSIIAYIRQEGETGHILHGFFSGIHVGLGFSIGGLIGGLMVHEYGHSVTFVVFGEVSLIVTFLFLLVNNIFPYTKYELEAFKKTVEVVPRFQLQMIAINPSSPLNGTTQVQAATEARRISISEERANWTLRQEITQAISIQ